MANIPKGLEALLGKRPSFEYERIEQVPVKDLSPNPFQPRTDFPQESLQELADSIKSSGMLQPIIATRRDGKLLVIAGERRLRAAQIAGLEKVPAIIRDSNPQDMVVLALLENLHREDLSVVEEAKAYKRLSDEFNITQSVVADFVKKSRSHVANTVRLLNLPQLVLDLLSGNLLSSLHARTLLSLEDPRIQTALAERAVKEKMSVRQLEDVVKQLAMPKTPKKPPAKSADRIKSLAAEISEKIGRRVWIQSFGKEGHEKGRISIEFYSPSDFRQILEVLHKYLSPNAAKK